MITQQNLIAELTPAEFDLVDGGNMDDAYNFAAGAAVGGAIGFLIAGPAGAVVIGAAYGAWGVALGRDGVLN
ncbi:hypothetical protein [Sphingomonas sp. KR3-1]|uniref:hypothetical protein n=1 Tax=Sphingomonas sp. KR3-1 TaxID=3156611 RepID=UPI0032B52273